MSDSNEIQIMRAMAWERAKGELNSILSSYYSEGNYEKMKEEVEKFIEKIEEDELYV